MSAGTSASFCLLLSLLLCSSEALEYIRAELGQDVTLPCKAAKINEPITAANWIKPALDPGFVLVYRDGTSISENQDPFYKNRADLKDKEVNDGDVSLVLKNVTTEDKGIYKCYVGLGETGRWLDDPINIIYLKVLPPGDKDGGDKDGGDKDGGDKDGGDKDGGDKVGGDKAGIILGVVGLMLLLVF